jgi:membrane protein DedA with SNARE-associated domain/rhodanese-related sulfurtransferase
MNPSAQFLLHHGYAILFWAVLAEQIGLPLPSTPLLLAAGALAGLHRMNPVAALSLAITASLISDSAWYCLGRQRGGAILGHVCRVSLEPEACVSRTHSLYFRYGSKSLLFCKFVPGLGTLGPPMAGMMKVPPWRFLLLDAGGALVWSGTFVAIGWLFRTELEILGDAMARLGAGLLIILAAALVVYVAMKYIKRLRFYRTLRVARISPFELRHRLDAHEKLTIIDLRNPTEWREGRIPGSLQFEESELDSRISTMADAETILYCSCPDEAASARAALRLKRRGVRRVRPLEGGFENWRKLGFPVDPYRAFKAV